MTVTTTTASAALKRIYSKAEVANLVYKSNPLYAMVKKTSGFEGDYHAFAIQYRDSLGRGHIFADVQTLTATAAGNFLNKQFLVTRVKEYGTYVIETEAKLAGASKKGSFLKLLTTEVDSCFNHLARSQAQQLYRDGSGLRAKIATGGVASTVITLEKKGDITNFEPGQVLVGCPTSVTTNLRNSGTGATITAVDRMAGTITVDANSDSLAAGDFLFIKGDRAATGHAVSTYRQIAGLEAWVPESAPSSTAFFNVDRSSDPTRLGGLRKDISSFNPEEGIIISANLAAREGASPSHLFMNFSNLTDLQNSLGAKVTTEYQTSQGLGFKTIPIMGPKGTISVVPDANCPENVGWLLDMPTWELMYMGDDVLQLLDYDGNVLSRVYNADAWEGRIAFFGNLKCTAPGKNMRLVLPTTTVHG